MTDMLTAREQIKSELYVNGYGFDEYLEHLRDVDRGLFDLLCPERCAAAERQVADMNERSWEFESDRAGGRGAAYNAAQKSTDNRQVGMRALLKCFWSSADPPGEHFRILDVLGGNGTVARFCRTLAHRAPTIYTADVSKFMIDACHAQGLPCVRQPATRSLFRDEVLDGVLIAYGSHHLDYEARRLAVGEARRTLRPGGRLVLHDFEIGGGGAKWFDTVVHPYSRTGHPHPHFSRAEMFRLLSGARFHDVTVFEIADPFTLCGRSADEARQNAVMHMYEMYDLVKLAGDGRRLASRLERHIADTLGPISVRRLDDRYVATIPRQALVAVGTRPAARQ